MRNAQQRHDISNDVWKLLKPHLPGQRGQWRGIAQDNRRFTNGMFWILRTGAPWRDLPPYYGKWGMVHQRFRRWRDKRRINHESTTQFKIRKIHHSDILHVQSKPAYISFLPIQEAIAYAKGNRKQPSPCTRC